MTALSYDPKIEKSDAKQIIARSYRYKILGKDTLKIRIAGSENKIKTFNKQGLKIKEAGLDTHDLVLWETIYSYNRTNRIRLIETYENANLSKAIQYRYNNRGNVKRAKSKSHKDKRFKYFFKCSYEYLERDRRIIQTFANKHGAYSRKEYFLEKGKCLYEISVHQSSNTNKGYSITKINQLNQKAQVEKSSIHTNIFKNQAYVIETDSIFYQYNEAGLLEEWTGYENSFASDQRPVQNVLKRKYVYDALNRLKRKEKIPYFVITEYEYIYE